MMTTFPRRQFLLPALPGVRTTTACGSEANPLVVCDVAPDAFSKDYPRREGYVAKSLEHVDWNEVAQRYKAVARM